MRVMLHGGYARRKGLYDYTKQLQTAITVANDHVLDGIWSKELFRAI